MKVPVESARRRKILRYVRPYLGASSTTFRLRLRSFRKLIANLYAVAGDIHFLAIYSDMAVGDQLASACPAAGEAQPINQVVKTALKQDHEVFTSNTWHTNGYIKSLSELPLAYAVEKTQFLFLLELPAVVRQLAPALSVLPRWIWAFP